MTRHDSPARRTLYWLLVAAGLHACTTISTAHAAEEGRGSVLNVVCAPDRPVVYPGESVILRAWVTDALGKPPDEPVHIAWSASAGTVDGREVATWRFAESENVDADGIEVSAKALVQQGTRGLGTCEVRAHLAVRPLARGLQAGAAVSARHSGRAFLLPINSEPPDYGLYTYLLFETPPKDQEERNRYLKAIEAYLLVLDPLAEMERYRSRSQLNVTMLPVRSLVAIPPDLSDPARVASAAQQVLAVYDYPRAKALLAEMRVQAIRGGPYLLSRTASIQLKPSAPLFFDMSHVSPALVWDWIKAVCALAAQERSWSEVTITKLGLNIRNVIAVSANEIADVGAWIRVLSPR